MGYLHIENLYRAQTILQYKEVYALEKIHGTSAHIAWRNGEVSFFSGGEKHSNFITWFDEAALKGAFIGLAHDEVVVHGEAYGGNILKQAWRYGEKKRFVAFDVRVGDTWLDVPDAHDVANKLGLEFVHYEKIPCVLSTLDAQRDAPSTQAIRNGVDGPRPREGIVIRPLVEARDKRGNRIITKHKRDEERETATPRKVVDPARFVILQQAQAIADEWVTQNRLEHILDKLGENPTYPEVIAAMTEDVLREGAGELVDSKEARQAIGRATAILFRRSQQVVAA